MLEHLHLSCTACATSYSAMDRRYRCDCGGTLDVVHDLEALRGEALLERFDARRASPDPIDRSGVWRFRELILPVPTEHMVSRSEGNTHLYDSARVARYTGMDRVLLKHEGENPTASFKDRGMTAGVTMARVLGMDRVACASTGNTSASMAAYAAQAEMRAYVFIPEGNVAYGKLSQAMAYGARTLQISDDFDAAMALVQQVCDARGIYLVNSVNPWRIEGQKAIGFELLQDLQWQVPDWIVLPGGNLGNNSAIAKGLTELKALGLIPRLPRIAVIQASGANPLFRAWSQGQRSHVASIESVKAHTIATAIKIGNPVSWRKSMRGLEACLGTVEEVTDQEILDAKAQVDAAGIGAEPASCASVAGLKKLVTAGVIQPSETVACVLTGHLLKDPDNVVHYHLGELEGFVSTYANPPISVEATLEAVLEAVDR